MFHLAANEGSASRRTEEGHEKPLDSSQAENTEVASAPKVMYA